MKRERESFLDKVEKYVPLGGTKVLEIGCGGGTQSGAIARRCHSLVGIDPDREKITLARQSLMPNARFIQSAAQKLPFDAETFDAIFFTLSFHHIPKQEMERTIDEALRVLKKSGHIIFLEPGTKGSFFEAEILFEAGDGNETEAKANAHDAMLGHPRLKLIAELPDETTFTNVFPETFERTLAPKTNLGLIETFLVDRDFTLWAERRINIFKPR